MTIAYERNRTIYKISTGTNLLLKINVYKNESLHLNTYLWYTKYNNKRNHRDTYHFRKTLHHEEILAVAPCLMCGKPTELKHARKYCSPECYSESIRRRSRKRYEKTGFPLLTQKKRAEYPPCPICNSKENTQSSGKSWYCTKCNTSWIKYPKIKLRDWLNNQLTEPLTNPTITLE